MVNPDSVCSSNGMRQPLPPERLQLPSTVSEALSPLCASRRERTPERNVAPPAPRHVSNSTTLFFLILHQFYLRTGGFMF